MSVKTTRVRLIELDVLRCVAVILVVLHHCWSLDFSGDIYSYLGGWMPVVRVGWIGVPIFFVLSGFLIGNMLFKEYQKNKEIRVKRFLVRRGFKIYPTLYVSVAIYSLYLIVFEGGVSLERVLREIFFFQNYGAGGVIAVSWSLAIEEHFYFLFPSILLILISFGGRKSTDLRVLFKPLIYLSALMVVACLVLRIQAYQWEKIEKMPLRWFATQLRIDALFIGACLAYWYVGWPKEFDKMFRRLGWSAVFVCVLLFVFPSFKPNEQMAYFAKTYYLVLLSGASAIVLGVLLIKRVPETFFFRASAYIGRHSYGIYLFHFPVILVTNKVLARFTIFLPAYVVILFCVIVSCCVGIVATHVIEWPMLKIRDRFFPSSINSYFVRGSINREQS